MNQESSLTSIGKDSKQKTFSDMDVKSKENITTYFQQSSPKSWFAMEPPNFQLLGGDYQQSISQFLDPMNVNMNLISKQSLLTPKIPQSLLFFPFDTSLKTMVYLFQIPKVVVDTVDNQSSIFNVLKSLNYLVKICGSKKSDFDNTSKFDPNIIQNPWSHPRIRLPFQLSQEQLHSLNSVCIKNVAQIETTKKPYLFEFLNIHNSIDDLNILFYEPFSGSIPYPYHFKLHLTTTVSPVLNDLSSVKGDLQEIGFKMKKISSHPAFSFVFRDLLSGPNVYSFHNIVLSTKYNVYRPSAIQMDTLTYHFKYSQDANLDETVSDIFDFVSLTKSTIKRFKLVYSYISEIENNKLLSFYSTILTKDWIREFEFEFSIHSSPNFIFTLLNLFFNVKKIPLLRIPQDVLKQINLFTPFIQVLIPDEPIIMNPYLMGIEFHFPTSFPLNNIGPYIKNKIKEVDPFLQWKKKPDEYNSYHILVSKQ